MKRGEIVNDNYLNTIVVKEEGEANNRKIANSLMLQLKS